MKVLESTKHFKITRVKREAFWDMKEPHYHDYHEFYYLVSGERNYFLNETIYQISKGDIIFIPAGVLHKTTYRESAAHERVAVSFDDSFMQPLYDMLGKDYVVNAISANYAHVPEGRRAYIEELMQKMIYESDNIDELSETLIATYLQELILFFIRCQKNYTGETELDVTNELIQKAAKYIYSNYDKNLTLVDVAEQFGMSSSYFSKKFKAITGFGFKEYLTSIRIKEACEMLSNSHKSITDVAISCGFNDSNYFGDAFRKIKGQSPSRYRRNNGSI